MLNKGFSLLEIIVVLFILTLIFLIGFQGINSYRLKSYQHSQQQKISAFIDYARQNAQKNNQDIILLFEEHGIRQVLAGQELAIFQLSTDFQAADKKLGFTADGNTKYAGTVYFYYQKKPWAKFVLAPGIGLTRWEKL